MFKIAKTVSLAIFIVIAIVSSASASQLVRVLQSNTLWGITEALSQPGKNWTQLYQENPNLPPISIDRQGRNIVWIQAGEYLQVPDSWNLGYADPGSVYVVKPEYAEGISVPPVSFGSENPLSWMGSTWFQVLVAGLLVFSAFVLGGVFMRRSGQPMYGGIPSVPMTFPPMMRNELNFTLSGAPPAVPVVGEVSTPTAPVVVSEPTAREAVVDKTDEESPAAAGMPSAEVAPPAKADTHAAGE